jgi:hypothetical protein
MAQRGRWGCANDTQASRDRTTPPRAPTVRDPPPAGEGEMSDLVLATRSASELDPWRGAKRQTFSAIHRPPLAFLFPLQRGEAERRQTQIQPPRLRTARAQRSAHACRRSTAALARGSISSQRLSFRPGFLGRGLNGRYPPSPVPVQGCTSHPGHNAGRLIPKPPGSRLQIRPRVPYPLHLTACLRKASLGERDFFLQNDAATVVKCGR